MTETTPVIVVDRVAKRFVLDRQRPRSLKELVIRRRRRDLASEFWALSDVSFEVPRGRSFGVIGHNGSGKSTLLRIMAGIHRPTTGSVSTSGRVSALLELGSGFHPELTGRENVFLNGAILGIPKRRMEEVLSDIVAFADIGEFIDQPVKVYSSGMYVRLGYAVAVHVDPEILLIDEVFAVGDEDFQRKCLEHMYELRRHGVTIVVVSHSLPLVQMLCDEAIWLDHGKVLAAGTADEVVRTYGESVTVTEAERHLVDESVADRPESVQVHGGSGGVALETVQWLTHDHHPVQFLVTGSDYVARIWYRATRPIDELVITIDVLHERGTLITSYTSRRSAVDPLRIAPGDGYIDLQIAGLALNPGVYHLASIFSDGTGFRTFDRVDRVAEFYVRSDTVADHRGLTTLPGTFVAPVATMGVVEQGREGAADDAEVGVDTR